MDIEEIMSNPKLTEQLIIKQLYTNLEFRDQIMPYIKPEYFQYNSYRDIMSSSLDYIKKYNGFPTPHSMALNYNELDDSTGAAAFLETMSVDVGVFNQKQLRDVSLDYIKRSVLNNYTNSMHEIINSTTSLEKMGSVPDEIRDILALSFDTNLGLDILSEEGLIRLHNYINNPDVVISTGLPSLDGCIKGGIRKKTFTLFMAATNVGKSLVMGAIACNAAQNSSKILYISLEMCEEMVAERVVSNLLDIDINKGLYNITAEKLIGKYKAVKNTMHNNFRIKEYPPGTVDCNTIRSLLKDMKDKDKFEPDIIVVDYMGLMKSNDKRIHEKHNVLKAVSEELRAIAVEFDVTIVSAAQTNRGGVDNQDLDVDDVADSYSITMVADVIIAIIQSKELRELKKYIFAIVKNRFGINKQAVSIAVDYDKMRLDDLNEKPKIMGAIDDEEPKRDNSTYAISNKVKYGAEKVREMLMKKNEIAPKPVTFKR